MILCRLGKTFGMMVLSVLLASCSSGYLQPYHATLLEISGAKPLDVITYVPQHSMYTGYKINDFDVIVNPDRPNELMIYRSGEIALLINDTILRVYHPNPINLPLSEYEMFT